MKCGFAQSRFEPAPGSRTVSITTKANLQNEPEAVQRLGGKREGHVRGRWSLAIAGLILIVAGGLLAHLTQTSRGIRI
jgi:hypothetical protein